MVKQPDTPAGPAAEDEPAGPATDPHAGYGSAWPAADPPAGNGSAWPAGGPLAGEPMVSPSAAPFPPIPAGPPGPLPTEGGHPPELRPAAPPPRLWLTVAAALLGVAGLAISLVGVASQVLPRRFTAAQQQQIMSWQVAGRWRSWPAGKIFPASVSYHLTEAGKFFGTGIGLTLAAHRVGIAPQARCSAAVDPALARMLSKRGCEAVLRATYTDSTGSFAVTVGIVIMHGSAPAAGSLPAGHHGLPPGVRPVPFPGTLAARFGGRQRQMSETAGGYGPYLFLYTAGYTDGRQRELVASNPYASSEMKDVVDGLKRGVGAVLGARPPAPRCPGAPGC